MTLLVRCSDSVTDDDGVAERAARSRQDEKRRSPLRATDSEDYYGSYRASDYDGLHCDELERDDYDEYQNCEDICDEVYGSASDRCEDLPVELIEDLKQLYDKIYRLRVGDNTFSDISAFNFGVMIDVDTRSALDLIRNWSEREVGEFLIWIANRRAVSLALLKHDDANEILERALKKLSGSGRESLGLDLEGFGRTYFAIAEDADNVAAFEIGHKIIVDECNNDRSCKQGVYCIREESDQFRRGRDTCHYSSSDRYSRNENCYIQGPDVWSFFNTLIDEGDIRDTDFPRNYHFDEEECDMVCRTEECDRGEID